MPKCRQASSVFNDKKEKYVKAEEKSAKILMLREKYVSQLQIFSQ